MLADFADKLTEEIRNKLQKAMHETRDAVQQHNAGLASEKLEQLNKVIKEAGVIIYSQQPNAEGVYKERKVGPGSNTTSSTSRPSGEKVVDADYEESN